MEELLKRIEIYNIINFLFPGTVFVLIYSYITGGNAADINIGIGILECYFVGLIVSRIGSVIIKPILKAMHIIIEEEYEEFIDSEKKDDKISMLVRDANQYRTFIAVFVILFIVEVNNMINGDKSKWMTLLVFVGTIGLFVLSYRKQVIFISKRVRETQKN